jgi:hypothetical protein
MDDNYTIGIKNWTRLSEVNTSVTLTADKTTVADFGTTREGDIDNNDWIYLGDLLAFPRLGVYFCSGLSLLYVVRGLEIASLRSQ